MSRDSIVVEAIGQEKLSPPPGKEVLPWKDVEPSFWKV